jgi:acylphosphatase|tara:strand:- start:173 stop:877 length:705 start_codon:yes stop_codon:yes gene_type:complete
MAEEQKTETIEETKPVEQATEQKEEEKIFNLKQNELERIIQKRIAQERSSLEKKYSGIDPEEARKLKQEKEEQEVERKKQRGEFEDLLKQQADKFNQEKTQLQKQLEQIKINDALVNSAVKNKAINPEQVTNLLKGKVKLNDDGRVEVLAENNQPRYNSKGELLSVDDYVQEFITQNPHFQAATPSGSGSKANVGKVDARPFNIADLDMSKADDRKAYAEYRKQRDSKPAIINQ